MRRPSRSRIPAFLLSALLASAPAGCVLSDEEPAVLTRYPLEEGWVRVYDRSLEVEVLDASGLRFVFRDSSRVEATGHPGSVPPDVSVLTYTHLFAGPVTRQDEFFLQDERGLRRVIPAGRGGTPPPNGEEPVHVGMPGMLRAVLLEGPDRGVDGDTEHTVLSYPLTPGNEWIARARPPVVRRRVEGIERIEVPAGRFRTVRIRTEILQDPPLVYDDWIADVGLVRRRVAIVVPDLLFPGYPAAESVRERVDLVHVRRPGEGGR